MKKATKTSATSLKTTNHKRSSVIARTMYNTKTRELTVEFNNGSVYSYDRVSPVSYNRISTARSVGSAFNKWLNNR